MKTVDVDTDFPSVFVVFRLIDAACFIESLFLTLTALKTRAQIYEQQASWSQFLFLSFSRSYDAPRSLVIRSIESEMQASERTALRWKTIFIHLAS